MVELHSTNLQFLSTNNMKNRIEECRKRMRYSQEDLAKLIDVTKSSISLYEKGNTDIPSSRLKAMAEVLHVSIDYLLGLDDSPQPINEELKASEPNPVYGSKMRVNIDTIEQENQHLKEINQILERYNEDQSLLIDLLREREGLPRKMPKKVEERLTRHKKSAS